MSLFDPTDLPDAKIACVTALPPRSTLASLAVGVARIVRAEPDERCVSRAVAELLRPFLQQSDLLNSAQLEADPRRYRQHILHVEADGSFSIAALVWLPGQATPIHDHASWCVVGVYRGTEFETRYELGSGGECLVETGSELRSAGSVEALLPPGDIHQVSNRGHGVAVSLHIYGADLGARGSSIRRNYELPIRKVAQS